MKKFYGFFEIIFFILICTILSGYIFIFERFCVISRNIAEIFNNSDPFGYHHFITVILVLLAALFSTVVRAYVFVGLYKMNNILPTLHKFFDKFNKNLYIKIVVYLAALAFDFVFYSLYEKSVHFDSVFLGYLLLSNGVTFSFLTLQVWMSPKSEIERFSL